MARGRPSWERRTRDSTWPWPSSGPTGRAALSEGVGVHLGPRSGTWKLTTPPRSRARTLVLREVEVLLGLSSPWPPESAEPKADPPSPPPEQLQIDNGFERVDPFIDGNGPTGRPSQILVQ